MSDLIKASDQKAKSTADSDFDSSYFSGTVMADATDINIECQSVEGFKTIMNTVPSVASDQRADRAIGYPFTCKQSSSSVGSTILLEMRSRGGLVQMGPRLIFSKSAL